VEVRDLLPQPMQSSTMAVQQTLNLRMLVRPQPLHPKRKELSEKEEVDDGSDLVLRSIYLSQRDYVG
jgi:hypothetical protein